MYSIHTMLGILDPTGSSIYISFVLKIHPARPVHQPVIQSELQGVLRLGWPFPIVFK